MKSNIVTTDILVIGASFAGLAAAKQFAQSDLSVAILERKKVAGQGMHTTGILVQEAIDLLDIPDSLTNDINRVKLYAPNLKDFEIRSENDYLFQTTNTPELIRYLTAEVESLGVKIHYGEAFREIEDSGNGYIVNDKFQTRYVIGADGAKSAVAEKVSLGQNKRFLLGAEAEFEPIEDLDQDMFHVFLNQKLAKGYLGWVIPSVGVTQVGVATILPVKPDIQAFIDHVAPLFGLKEHKIVARRGGLIPVGAPVSPLSKDNIYLVGDAAGIVSPLTAGGIHTALLYGQELAQQIIEKKDASKYIRKSYPKFRKKRFLRNCFELAPNWLLNILIGSKIFQKVAYRVFFIKKKL